MQKTALSFVKSSAELKQVVPKLAWLFHVFKCGGFHQIFYQTKNFGFGHTRGEEDATLVK